ncbi:MAG: rhamnulokinase [Bacteroidales bacterium]|nr:rhamnulokinase [Candidatus Sodaliphilus aphodohippi]
MTDSYCCAIDLGATSGRIVIQRVDADNRLSGAMEEVRRFPHAIVEDNGRCYWNIDLLQSEIVAGLRDLARRDDVVVRSVGVDTWGVDMAFVDENGNLLAAPRAYRDPYTAGMIEQYCKTVPMDEVYRRTGIQFMPFNTLFQLFACSQERYEPFLKADKYLFMPDFFNYWLSGRMACEYTIASTSQFLNPVTKQIDADLIAAAGARIECFAPMVMPGTVLGSLRREIADFGYDVPVVAVAGHDTASAVAAVPADTERYAYLSSGTWSLMGIVSREPVITPRSRELNFTNEGGLDGTTRLLKNITGMWILEQCRKEWKAAGKDYSYPDIMQMFGQARSTAVFNPDDEVFANPHSMLGAIAAYCAAHGMPCPESDGEVVRSIFESLAARYGQVFAMLHELAPWPIEKLYVIGGGARNELLNRLTEEAIGVPVIAGPTEATAMGNLMVQARAINQIVKH